MGKEMRERRDAKMTLGVVLMEGWRSPKPTSHHPGPQPTPEQPPPPPGSWGRGRGAPHPWRAPRGWRIQNNTAEARERHGSALGAVPLAGAALWAERSASLPPAARDTRAVPKVTRAAFAAHKRDSVPSSWEKPLHSQLCFEFQTQGISATCRRCALVPRTWSDS